MWGLAGILATWLQIKSNPSAGLLRVDGNLLNHVIVSVIALNHREILGTPHNYRTVLLSYCGKINTQNSVRWPMSLLLHVMLPTAPRSERTYFSCLRFSACLLQRQRGHHIWQTTQMFSEIIVELILLSLRNVKAKEQKHLRNCIWTVCKTNISEFIIRWSPSVLF